MEVSAQPIQHYRFGVFTADPQSGELRKQGIRLKLQERPFQLLIALLERPGEIVTREELRQRLWPDGTFVDFDHSISSAINKLRSVLNDSATHPRYVETVGRRGYRFLADVKEILATRPTVEDIRKENDAEVVSTLAPFRARRLWTVALGSSLILMVALGSYFLWKYSRSKPAPAAKRVMLAVLPFENLTGDPGQDYFSDGLTEEMISELGQLNPEHLGVIARTSVMLYKHSPKSIDQIGRELAVDYVIEGSVRRDANNVRVAAQLIQVADQTHVWARQYDRELRNLLVLQGEIAQEVADEIQLSLGTKVNAANRAPATSYEAYDLYLKGRYFWNKRTEPGFTQAAEYFQQAIDKDPKYARAYAGLADTFALMTTWNMVPQNDFSAKARAAALKALELDDALAEAHTSLALIVESYDYDWQTAEREFRRAIQLNPEYATAHQWYAEYLGWQGRFDEAFRESELSRQLDPMSVVIARDHMFLLYYGRQYDRALAEGRTLNNMDPQFGDQGFISSCYVEEKRFAEALGMAADISEEPWAWAYKSYLYGQWGRVKEAERAREKFEQVAAKLGPHQLEATLIAYSDGVHKERLIALLQKAYSEHSPLITNLKVEPRYDPLRSDPRFQELLRRMGLG